MTNCRVVPLTSSRPSVPVRVPKKPMMNEPVTLMMSVPQGKVSPNALATDAGQKIARHGAKGAAGRHREIHLKRHAVNLKEGGTGKFK